MAIGDPLNFDKSVTVGVVSAKGRYGLTGDAATRNHLIHLQTGIVRMSDHDLGLADAACRTLAGFFELPQSHLAESGFCFLGVLGGWSRTSAGWSERC